MSTYYVSNLGNFFKSLVYFNILIGYILYKTNIGYLSRNVLYVYSLKILLLKFRS